MASSSAGTAIKFLLIPVGSAGDVHPFIGLGRRLRDRGHRVTVVTNNYFEELVRKQGLDFVQLGTRDEFLETVNDPRLWDPLLGFELIWSDVIKSLQPLYDIVKTETLGGDTVVAGASLALGARVAQEKLGLPFATVHLQPSVFRSLTDPPRLPPRPVPRWFPPWAVAAYFRLGDLYVDKKIGAGLNQFRASLGLPPVKHLLDQWWHSPQLTLGLFPEWFSGRPADWPSSVRLTGFPLYDESDLHGLPEDLELFLQQGPAPIVFTPGSAMSQGERFFKASVEACIRLGARGLLVTKFPSQLPRHLPVNVQHVSYVPFSKLLPRASLFVHHGGIGTTAQALAAGVPQLLMPLAFDQPDNAARVAQLGAGVILPPHRYTAVRAADTIRAMLANEPLHQSCRALAARFIDVDPIDETCRLLEELGEKKRP